MFTNWNKSEQYSFFRIPKMLFTESYFSCISVEAKVLYGLLIDRMSLSAKNGWLDNAGKVYIYYTLEDVMALLCCGKDKAIKLYKELEQIGLVERKRQGQGRPTKVYVNSYIMDSDTNYDNPKTLTAEKPRSAHLKSRRLEVVESVSNKTDNNKTEKNKSNQSIHPKKHWTDKIDSIDRCCALIKKNIDYDILLHDIPHEKNRIDGFVDLMVEVCCSNKESMRVNQEDIPVEIVKTRILTLDSEHVRYVMECMDKNTNPIANIRAYTLSALYNAPMTISQYYASVVNYDMTHKFKSG